MADFDRMNETDVRESVVRPLLERLGYRHGTEANIRTEISLKYDKAFLGRKNPKKDPPLAGRADYICEVISYGRWVVEVKAPTQKISRDVIEQAHTYAAHPEIAASYFLVTNGREFELYRTGQLDAPTLKWSFDQIEQTMMALFNIVGPAAIKKAAKLGAADPGKPLGLGISSQVQIIGGDVTYEDHKTDVAIFAIDTINGLKLPVTGGSVSRDPDGRLHAHVEIAQAAAMFRGLEAFMGGADGYEFYSSSEYVSTDAESPTIFQNWIQSVTPVGTQVAVPGLGNVPLPFTIDMIAITEAVGFVEDDLFKGTMHLSYDFTISQMSPQIRPLLEAQVGRIPARSQFEGGGRFEVKLLNRA